LWGKGEIELAVTEYIMKEGREKKGNLILPEM